jgi:hypothetical protein
MAINRNSKSIVKLILYIPLQEFCLFKKNGTVIDTIGLFLVQNQLNYQPEQINVPEFKKLLTQRAKEGELVWIFDGWSNLEEISTSSDPKISKEASQFAKEILSFIDQDTLMFSKVIITSRT